MALVTVMVMVLDVASRKFPCAALVAVTSQVPAAVPVSVEPEMEQEPVPSTAVKVTAPVPSPPDVDNVVEVPYVTDIDPADTVKPLCAAPVMSNEASTKVIV